MCSWGRVQINRPRRRPSAAAYPTPEATSFGRSATREGGALATHAVPHACTHAFAHTHAHPHTQPLELHRQLAVGLGLQTCATAHARWGLQAAAGASPHAHPARTSLAHARSESACSQRLADGMPAACVRVLVARACWRHARMLAAHRKQHTPQSAFGHSISWTGVGGTRCSRRTSHHCPTPSPHTQNDRNAMPCVCPPSGLP